MREMHGVGERNRRAGVVGRSMLHSMRALVLIVVAGLVATACGSAASEQATVVLAAPPATAATTIVPSPTASAGGTAPMSVGAVPDAGVLYVWGADDGIYRYDGATGALARVWGASTLSRESAYGPYGLGRHGGTTRLNGDGRTKPAVGAGHRPRVRTI